MSKQEDVSGYPEVFVSIDIETTGPVPGLYSMISLGAASFSLSAGIQPISTFYANLEEDSDAWRDAETMEWWSKHIDAWEEARKEPQNIKTVMHAFQDWVGHLGPNVVPVYYPSGYDMSFINYYSQKHLGKVFLNHRAIDIQTLAWAVLGSPFAKNCRQSAYPKEWLVPNNNKHKAVDDAIAQGQMFMLVRHANELRKIPTVYSEKDPAWTNRS